MGDIADLMLDGQICQFCGMYLCGGADGIPRTCKSCQSDVYQSAKVEKKQKNILRNNRQRKIACPECGKKVKEVGLVNHMADSHSMEAPTLGILTRQVTKYEIAVDELKRRLATATELLRAAECPDPECCKGVICVATTEHGCCEEALPTGECCGNSVPVQGVDISQCQFCAEKEEFLGEGNGTK